jgi:uncharacterized protein (DUF2141 family)
MKSVFYVLIFIFAPLLSSGQSTLTIKVEGLKKNKGELFIGLYNNEKTFKNTDSVFVKQIISVDSLVMKTKMENLPDGQYALTLFHDENSNGKLDKNFLGAPKERYGFSNNPRIVFKSPQFKKCQFPVSGDTEVLIKMKK